MDKVPVNTTSELIEDWNSTIQHPLDVPLSSHEAGMCMEGVSRVTDNRQVVNTGLCLVNRYFPWVYGSTLGVFQIPPGTTTRVMKSKSLYPL